MGDGETTRLLQWIDRLQAGDDSVRDDLIDHVAGRMTRLARKMLGGFPGVHRWEQTDDVANAAMMRLLRALEQVRPPTGADFFRLATAQVRRELIDLSRHYYGPQGLGAHHDSVTPRGDDSASPAGAAVDPAGSTAGPEQLASWTEFHSQAAALPDPEREVFDLLWYQGMKQEDAARVLGVDVRTVKRRWSEAKCLLYRALDGQVPGL